MRKYLLNASVLLAAGFLLPAPAAAQVIATGAAHSFALCSDSTVRAWGYDYQGQLGNGTNTNSNVPVQVSSLTGITAIAGGGSHSLALKIDGTVWAWGSNMEGELGNGTTADSNVPVQVSSLTGITAVAGGETHSLALKNDGTVWAWGDNYSGELGNGTNINSTVPVQVSSLTGITAIAGGGPHSLALKNDGTLWAWGINGSGQLGNGTNIDSNVPVQVSSLAGITAIAAGGWHSLALKNDGRVWAWGANNDGQLGNGSTILGSNVPVEVSSLTGIIAIAGGNVHSLALKNNGTVWAWGNNSYGELGIWGQGGDANVPVQTLYLTGIAAIASHANHSLALKNDGSVWAWGWGDLGQLGNGASTTLSVAVQVIGLCEIATDLEEHFDDASITVFPNPTSGKFTMECLYRTRSVEIGIRNVMGQEIHRTTVIGTRSEMDLSSQPGGVYVLSIRIGGQVITRKMIKE